MKIHFICTSNTFRSRLAETYLRSKKIPGVEVSSSGVEAKEDPNGPITWYAQRIIEKNKLVRSEPLIWTQTTKEILNSQDLVIFMEREHYDQCRQRFGFESDNFEIWDTEDIESPDLKPDSITIPKTEEIYQKIIRNVDDLVYRKKLLEEKR